MKCGYPYATDHGATVACGRCANCRINRRSEMAARGIMEAQDYPDDYVQFVTFTTNEDFRWTVDLPDRITGQVVTHDTLDKAEAQKLMKRIRRLAETRLNRLIRYLLAGEFGGQFGRGHLHAILYGLTQAEAIDICTRAWSVPRSREGLVSDHVDVVKVKTPNTHASVYHYEPFPCSKTRHLRGFLTFGEGNALTVAYTAGYTLSGMAEAKTRTEGIQKEFALWSKHPPLGARFAESFGKHLVGEFQIVGLPSTYSQGKPWHGIPNAIHLPTPNGVVPYRLDKTMQRSVLKGMGVDPDGHEIAAARRYAYETRQEAIMLPGDPLGLAAEAEKMQRESDVKAARAYRRHLKMRRENDPR